MAKKYSLDDLKKIDSQFLALLDSKTWSYLIVDPSPSFRRTLANTLQRAGAQNVSEAKDGVDALIQLQKIEGDVVTITELNTAELDGLALLQKMRADPKLAKMPIIFMSAENRKERIIAAIKGGAAAYLKKPFPPDAIVSRLESLNLL